MAAAQRSETLSPSAPTQLFYDIMNGVKIKAVLNQPADHILPQQLLYKDKGSSSVAGQKLSRRLKRG